MGSPLLKCAAAVPIYGSEVVRFPWSTMLFRNAVEMLLREPTAGRDVLDGGTRTGGFLRRRAT
jgi:hypothetical protein